VLETREAPQFTAHRPLVLVTGASGFTGGHLCRRLQADGYTVRALVRKANRDGGLAREGIQTIIGDLQDQESLKRAVDGVEIVFHIAAAYRQENIPTKEMFAINVTGTKNMLDAAVASGVRRFVHCSTVGVHGNVRNPPANEDAPYGPGDHYQRSKAEGERVALRYASEARLPVVIFRPGAIYGPGDLRFLKLFRAIKMRKFVMLGSGEVSYHLVYIDDLIDGILRCANNENAVGNVYIIAGSESVSLNKLVRTIADVIDVPPPRFRVPFTPVYVAGCICELICKPFGINPPLYRRRVDFFRKTRSFDISKAMRELNFRPQVDLRTGVRLTLDWYRANGYL
jgi:nucleoside-diphosphate-sugar epimerase